MDDTHLGKYRLLKLLATGGMGEVFLAQTEDSTGVVRRVVVKRILRHLAQDQSFIDMFLDEALLAAELSHPNIVRMRGLERDDDTFFIAMEFVHGSSLRGLLVAAPKIPPRIAARLVAQALKGLHYAHTRVDDRGQPLGILHRDVTPENVLVGFDGSVKLVDFGIAKAADSLSISEPGVLKGKYGYMAPEQFKESAVLDARADVYSMGVVLHELLLHARPDFAADSAEKAMAPRPPFRDRPELPTALNRVLRQALEPDLAGRFRTAQEMALVLEAYLQESGEGPTQRDVADFMVKTFGEEVARQDPSKIDVLGDEENPYRTMELPFQPDAKHLKSMPPELAQALTMIEPALQRQRRQDSEDFPPVPNEVARPRRWPLFLVAAVVGLVATIGLWRMWPAAAVVVETSVDAGTKPAGTKRARVGSLKAKKVVDAGKPVEAVKPVDFAKADASGKLAERVDAGNLDTDAPADSPKAVERSKNDDPTEKFTRRKARTGKVIFKLPAKVEVSLNGKRIGVTPVAPLELPPGSATFALRHKASGASRKVTVKVTAGNEVVVRADFGRK